MTATSFDLHARTAHTGGNGAALSVEVIEGRWPKIYD